MKIPTPEQLNQLHRAAADVDQVLATAIALAALTGARRGELAALGWSDVDLVAGRVRIARSLTVVGRTVHEGPTKTHQIRDIALDDAGVSLLRGPLGLHAGLVQASRIVPGEGSIRCVLQRQRAD
jgi:integrase